SSVFRETNQRCPSTDSTCRRDKDSCNRRFSVKSASTERIPCHISPLTTSKVPPPNQSKSRDPKRMLLFTSSIYRSRDEKSSNIRRREFAGFTRIAGGSLLTRPLHAVHASGLEITLVHRKGPVESLRRMAPAHFTGITAQL